MQWFSRGDLEYHISEEVRYDGFCAVITNLEGDVREILKINRLCREIEENSRTVPFIRFLSNYCSGLL